MFMIYIALFVFAAGVALRFICNDDEWYVLCFISGIIVFIGVLMTFWSYSNQLDDIEEVKRINQVEQIYRQKAEALTKKFAEYLAEKYPEHEKEIFSKMSPDKIDLYLVKYPEIKASETLMALVAKIERLENQYYEQKILREAYLKEMRFRLVNPWKFHSFIPIPNWAELEDKSD